MKVKVTQADIDNGSPGIGSMCPVRLALARQCPGLPKGFRVGAGIVYAENEFLYEMPIEVAVFVKRFDEGCAVDPFEFEINL